MQSKLSAIELLRESNPIYAFLEDDNYKVRRKKASRGQETYGLDVLIENPKPYLALCLNISSDFGTAKNYYETWDITDLYEFYTYKLAINYEPYFEEKHG